MKTIYQTLNRIKEFIEEQLEAHEYLMAREPEEGGDFNGELELVTPKVIIGNLPHANFSVYGDDDRFHQAPYILVGYDSASYEDDGESAQILIQACAYTQVQYAEGTFPDNMGILDVTQLLEAVMTWIEEDADFPVNKPYQIGTYASRAYTYPWAFGYLQFSIETAIGTLHQRRFYGLDDL